jgi:hypothetical protein
MALAKRVRCTPEGPRPFFWCCVPNRSAGKAGNLPSSDDSQERAHKGPVVAGPKRGQPWREGAAQRRGYPFPVSAWRPRSCGWLLSSLPRRGSRPLQPSAGRRDSGGVTPPGYRRSFVGRWSGAFPAPPLGSGHRPGDRASRGSLVRVTTPGETDSRGRNALRRRWPVNCRPAQGPAVLTRLAVRRSGASGRPGRAVKRSRPAIRQGVSRGSRRHRGRLR